MTKKAPESCSVLAQVAHDYFLESLPPEEVARVDRHVAGCEECAQLMRLCLELSCRDFVRFLDDYIDDQLPAERREVFERHLSICPDCRNYLESYRRVTELSALALADRAPVPLAPVPEELLRAVLDAHRRTAGR